MKRSILSLVALFVSVVSTAQLYVVSKSGEAWIVRNGKKEMVSVTMELQESDLLQTEAHGSVNVEDRKNHKPYSLHSPNPQSIRELIAPQRAITHILSKEFWNDLRNAFRDPAYDIDLRETTTGTSYRSQDGIDGRIAKSLISRQGSSHFDINFALLDLATEEPVTKVHEGQKVFVQINNRSNIPLFISIIDRDYMGKETALITVTRLTKFFDLYIPAMSSVRLNYYPYVFSLFPANTTDQLSLIASPIPFNLTTVLKLMQHPDSLKNTESCEIGTYKISVPITK